MPKFILTQEESYEIDAPTVHQAIGLFLQDPSIWGDRVWRLGVSERNICTKENKIYLDCDVDGNCPECSEWLGEAKVTGECSDCTAPIGSHCHKCGWSDKEDAEAGKKGDVK